MADKIDFYIAAVRYTRDRSEIASLKVHKNTEADFNKPFPASKPDVIKSIGTGTVFYTMYLNNGQWVNGAKVEIISVNGGKYLRTDRNNTPKDNLGSLPEF